MLNWSSKYLESELGSGSQVQQTLIEGHCSAEALEFEGQRARKLKGQQQMLRLQLTVGEIGSQFHATLLSDRRVATQFFARQFQPQTENVFTRSEYQLIELHQ